ncbi:Plasma membrane t-SNARE, secretory vesicle fusion [Savitreella phatthalungensis]
MPREEVLENTGGHAGYGGAAANPYAGNANIAAPINGNSYELQSMPAAVPVEDQATFFGRIDEIRRAIGQLDDQVARIEQLHARSLAEIGDEQSQYNHRELDRATTDAKLLQNNIRDTIKKLEAQNASMPAGQDNKVRVTQTNNVKKRMLESVKKFQKVEVEYKNKYRTQQKRQVEITNPNLSADEIERIVDTDQGQQVFAEATLRSNRHGEARSALRQVQERHQDIKKIERTIAELAELFNEMNFMMEAQQPQVAQIQEQTQNTEADIKQGNVELDKAVKHAKAARRKKWICFWIVVVIIIAVILGVTLGELKKRKTI